MSPRPSGSLVCGQTDGPHDAIAPGRRCTCEGAAYVAPLSSRFRCSAMNAAIARSTLALRSVLSELREDRSSVAVATKCCSLLNSYRNLYSLANADRSEEPARRDGRPGETLPLPCVRIAIPLWHPV